MELILDEDLVDRARGLTDDLSGVVESLLAAYVDRVVQSREQRRLVVADAMAAWNAHGLKHGSIADEYAPL